MPRTTQRKSAYEAPPSETLTASNRKICMGAADGRKLVSSIGRNENFQGKQGWACRASVRAVAPKTPPAPRAPQPHIVAHFHQFAMRQLVSNKSLLGQWLFEIGAVALASAAVAAMVILLINFDGEAVFDGPMITLNAIISTLSTTSRVCLLAMLASTISQWNWLLFSREPRRLVDFEYFSAASRGPLGSLKVLLDFRILGG